MKRHSPGALRAFVRGHGRLAPVAGLPGIRLHQADDVTVLWRAAGEFLGDPDSPLPFWAFPWAGGLAVAHYLREHPDIVAGRRVLDIATGSGLCAIAAALLGAIDVRAADISPLAVAAAAVNARANGVHVGVSGTDPLASPPPPCDVILAGDVFYEETMAARMHEWLGAAAHDGIVVLAGDPGRRFAPGGLTVLATYEVSTSRELERAVVTRSSVLAYPPAP